MENVLDFINDNSLLFIVGGVVVFLAIVGLIGEKLKKGKTKEEEKPVENVVEATPQDLFGGNAVTEQTQFNLYGQKEEPTVAAEFNYEAPVVDENLSNEIIPEVIPSVANEDLFAPLPSTEEVIPNVAPSFDTFTTTSNEDLFAPLTNDETPTFTDSSVETPTEETQFTFDTPVEENAFAFEAPVTSELTVPVEEPVVEESVTSDIPANNFQGFMGFGTPKTEEKEESNEDLSTRF